MIDRFLYSYSIFPHHFLLSFHSIIYLTLLSLSHSNTPPLPSPSLRLPGLLLGATESTGTIAPGKGQQSTHTAATMPRLSATTAVNSERATDFDNVNAVTDVADTQRPIVKSRYQQHTLSHSLGSTDLHFLFLFVRRSAYMSAYLTK